MEEHRTPLSILKMELKYIEKHQDLVQEVLICVVDHGQIKLNP